MTLLLSTTAAHVGVQPIAVQIEASKGSTYRLTHKYVNHAIDTTAYCVLLATKSDAG